MIKPLLFKSEPFEDELLSSWLTRNAYLNFMSLSSFLGSIFPRKYYYLRDIDLYKFNGDFYNTLEYLTKVPTTTIRNLQLYRFEGYIEEKIHTMGRHHWFTPAHPSKYKNSFFGIRFCPKCLEKSPYFKNTWRILFINICDKHQCYLLNRCTKCGSSIDFTKNSYMVDYTKCWKCSFDLKSASSSKLQITSHEHYSQKLLKDIMIKGYYIFQNKVYYSIGLFFLFRIIAKNILKIHTEINKLYIEELEAEVLSSIISEALKLLEKYPRNLIFFCDKYSFTNDHSFFDKYRNKKDSIPTWFSIKKYNI